MQELLSRNLLMNVLGLHVTGQLSETASKTLQYDEKTILTAFNSSRLTPTHFHLSLGRFVHHYFISGLLSNIDDLRGVIGTFVAFTTVGPRC